MRESVRNGILAVIVLMALNLVLFCERAPRVGLPVGDWIEHGFSADQRSALRAFFEQAVGSGDISGGSLLLLHKNEVVFREAFGWADIEKRRAFTTENACIIASVTKPITATLMAILSHRGVLSVDDTVEKWLPAFKEIRVRKGTRPVRPLLLWQVLSHRSGLPGTSDLGGDNTVMLGTLSDGVKTVISHGLLAEPGTRYSYGTAGYRTAARVAEVAAKQPFEALLKASLLTPLGMSNSTFRPTEEQMQECPQTYRRTEEGLVLEPQTSLNRFLDRGLESHGVKLSTLDDVGRFLLFHLKGGLVNGKRLVPKEALDRMYVIPTELSKPAYALGWECAPEGVGQIRHLGGRGTFVWVDFERELAGVFFTQVRWAGNRLFQRRLMETLKAVFEG